jgi:O-antigen/teichoic acid export membrane protein
VRARLKRELVQNAPGEPSSAYASLRSLLNTGSWAVVDQALFGGATFLVSIALARWLSPEEYGAFAVAFSVFLLLAVVHSSVLTEPMMIFGAREFSGSLRGYLGVLLWVHIGLTGLLSLLAWTASLLVPTRAGPLAATLGSMALASPFLLLQWLARRAFYAALRPRAAVAGSAIFLVLSVASVAALSGAGRLSGSSAFLAIGAAALAAATPFFFLTRPALISSGRHVSRRAVLLRHWEFGSWNILATGVAWLGTQLATLIVPMFLGLGAAAAMAAALNLYRPFHVLVQTSGTLGLAIVSRMVERDQPRSLRRLAARLALFYGLVALVYGGIVSILSRPLLHHVYSGRYDAYPSLVVLFAMASVGLAVVHAISQVLKTTGRVRSLLSVSAVSALVVVAFLLPAIRIWGIQGAVAVSIIGYGVAAVGGWRRLGRAEPQAERVRAKAAPAVIAGGRPSLR